MGEVLEILTACGLGEPRLWVRRYSDLSDGERFRAALARAVGQSLADGGGRPIVCDEFTAILHRRLAKALAYNLRKLVTRSGLILLAATTHDDILPDLRPDVIVRMGGATPVVETADSRPGAVSLQKRAVVEPGSVRDYARFAPMHYRHRDGLGFVDKVFLLRERAGGDPLGILVFAMAPAELSLRNRATESRFVRNIRRLNQELRILRRLVMHPDVRGCGLGHWFVQRALPHVGVRFVECLAAMGAVNPVFEKSGMTRVGRCPLPRGRLRLLERMQKHHVDPFAPDFHRRIGRCPRVRKMVEQTIHQWVAATTASQRFREKEHGPDELARCFRQLVGSPPIYYLWDREGRFPVVSSIDRHENEPLADADVRRDHHPDGRPSRPARPQRRSDPNRREAEPHPDRSRHDPGRRD